MDIECIQVNLKKSSLATGLFSHSLSTKPRIGFVTEPYTAFKKVVGKPLEYQVYPEIVLDSAPRAVLYIPKIIKCVSVPQMSNPDCQVALLYLQTGTILVASIYLDINLSPVPDWLEAITEYAASKRYPLLITMDSNAHSTLYGPDDNDRGRRLEQFIIDNGLTVVNRGNTPTFQTLQAESFIDITLVKDVEIHNWRVSLDYNASDHNSIYFEISQVTMVPQKEVRHWKLAKWDLFTSSLMRPGFSIPRIINKSKLDRMVEYLHGRIDEALDLACPRVFVKIKFKGSKWFTKKLKNKNIQVKKQYRIAKRIDTTEEWTKYFKIHKKFKYQCRKARTNNWRHFVTDTENENKMARLGRIAQHQDRAQLHTLQKEDGTFTNPGEETLIEMAKAHFPTAVRIEDVVNPTEDGRSLSIDEIRNPCNDIITIAKVKASLYKFHPFKAPGPDGVKAIAYKYFPDIVFKFICIIYMACVKLHYTPIIWQKALVVFLPKPGKPNYVRGKYFRPIVLSNGLLKGLERLFTWHMDDMLKYYPINGKQHGFTKGRSTESAISNTVDYIEKCLFKKQTCIGVFLDISSAYDSIKVDHIRESLYKHGSDTNFTEWYYHYLNNRILTLQLHGDMVRYHSKVGFPQGGVASAKFWLLAFNPAIDIINSTFVEGNGYADDCCIVFGGRKSEIIIKRLQRVINRLEEWGETCGLRFNPDKTIVVNFSRKLKQGNIPHLKVGNVYVPFSKEALYLGIKLDYKLYWRVHIKDKIAKSKRFLMKMAGISKAIWGPKPSLSRWTFRCVVRPMFVYGSVIWAYAINTPAIVERLRNLNRLALSTMTLVPRSTPTQAIEILTDTFPLHLWLEKEAICSYIRLFKLLPLTWSGKNRNKTRNTAHRRFWADKISEYDISELLLEIDTCYIRISHRNFVIHEDSFHQPISFYNTIPESYFQIFTDGSKIGNKVGAGFFIFHQSQKWYEGKIRLPNPATVFQAEVYAIYRALQFLFEHELTWEGRCHIFSDSMAALQALNSYEITSSVVSRLVILLNKISKSTQQLHLYWIKAHIGTEGNEMADKLAKEACDLTAITYVPLPRKEVRNQILNILRVQWKRQWHEYQEARHAKIFLYGPSKKLGKIICNLNRIDLRRIIMALTNHNSLNYHQSLQDDTINPTCRFCRMYDETFDHFFTCSSFERDRSESGISWPYSEDKPWKVEEILQFINNGDIKWVLDCRKLVAISKDPVEPEAAASTSLSETDLDEDMDIDITLNDTF